MNLSQLRYFIKTAELLNYSKAAEALFIARQSLRQTIAGLEEEIGKPLFVNTRNRLSLTEYGQYLFANGQGVLKSFDELQEGLTLLTAGSARLRIGFSISLFPFILPDNEIILEEFRSQFPDIRLDTEKTDNDSVITAVERGELDAGCVLQIPCPHKNCQFFPLAEYEVALDFEQQKPFGGKRYVELSDLEGISCQGMGSLEITMQPLWNHARQNGVSFPYEVVPSTLDAFYRIHHGLAVGFDILKTNVPEFSWEKTAILSGYKWELGFLCSDLCRDPASLKLFCRFMKNGYQTRWDRYNREFPQTARS
ncbi:MAG: LysR family transcriptional regulator [Oscillospiraceae bacterium]|nr:LysR family transcriptional regulator [Oscillospiraceae bacterium]